MKNIDRTAGGVVWIDNGVELLLSIVSFFKSCPDIRHCGSLRGETSRGWGQLQ